MSRLRLEGATLDAAVTLAENGASQGEIAALFGVSCPTVNKKLRARGVQFRRGRRPNDASQARGPLPTPDHLAVVERYRQGRTLREVGQEFGISGERVRQIVAALAPEATRNQRRVADEGYIHKFHRAAVEWTKRRTEPCRVCLRPNYRRHAKPARFINCSGRCARVWQQVQARRLLDDDEREKHDRRIARRVLRMQELYPEREIAHAKRVLAGDIEHRPYVAISEGSRTLDLLRSVGREDVIRDRVRVVPDDEHHREMATAQRKLRAREMAAQGKTNTWRVE